MARKHTLVLLNRSTISQKLSVQWQGAHWSHVEHTSFYHETQKEKARDQIVVEPGEILTLSDFAAAQ